MLNIFDFLIIGLFIVIIVSLYGILKPENAKNENISTKQIKKKIVKNFVNIKDKKVLAEAIEQMFKKNIEEGTNKLSKIDREFSLKSFAEDSKEIFKKILNFFEKKDRKNLKPLVSEKVYNVFNESIKELEKKEQTLDTEIVRFKDIIIKDINVENKLASIIIEFTSEQTTVLKDSNGNIIKGDDNYLETITDVWVFVRNYNVKNSKWLLYETVEL
ncbi:Tim44 domain-containing protein [bacterium]|nr:Tim44 domain-containing protein [bacterium]